MTSILDADESRKCKINNQIKYSKKPRENSRGFFIKICPKGNFRSGLIVSIELIGRKLLQMTFLFFDKIELLFLFVYIYFGKSGESPNSL